MALSRAATALVRETLAAALPGGRGAAAKTLARLLGVSIGQIYRAANLDGPKRARRPVRPEYRAWVQAAVALAAQAPKPAPLDLALRAAVASGDLPPEAARMPLGTAYRIAREEGLQPAVRRTHRISADYPMQAVLLDASTSQHLIVDRKRGTDADPLLRLHSRPYSAGGYKNKPLGPDRLRVVVYALWDVCTGVVRSRYVVARGESALGALEFLCWALTRSEDPRVVLCGAPDVLWADQGPLVKSAASRDLLERLGIELALGLPYAKERMGGVERTHRTRWGRFERSLFLRAGAETITLDQLNARLTEFEVEENGRRQSRTPVDGRAVSRTAAFAALMNRRPKDNPLRELPPDPIETLATEARRKIDVSGIIRWGGVVYESADWHDRWVIARRAADGSGDLAIEDEASGERRTARRWTPRPYGEVRSSPATPRDRLLANPAAAPAGGDVYAPAAGPPVVVPLPARTAPAAPLASPLEAGRCRDLAAAWRLFASIYPHPLSPGQRARLARHFEARGLARGEVTAVAQELVAAAGRKVSHG